MEGKEFSQLITYTTGTEPTSCLSRTFMRFSTSVPCTIKLRFDPVIQSVHAETVEVNQNHYRAMFLMFCKMKMIVPYFEIFEQPTKDCRMQMEIVEDDEGKEGKRVEMTLEMKDKGATGFLVFHTRREECPNCVVMPDLTFSKRVDRHDFFMNLTEEQMGHVGAKTDEHSMVAYRYVVEGENE